MAIYYQVECWEKHNHSVLGRFNTRELAEQALARFETNRNEFWLAHYNPGINGHASIREVHALESFDEWIEAVTEIYEWHLEVDESAREAWHMNAGPL
jgi:lipopolysaccharide/colanic/teichoic acid biosynthesis glycosyltransferase